MMVLRCIIIFFDIDYFREKFGMKRFFVAAVLFVFFVVGFEVKKIYFNCADPLLAPDHWMRKQIKNEINFFRRKKISIEKMEKHYSNYNAVIFLPYATASHDCIYYIIIFTIFIEYFTYSFYSSWF